LGRGSPGVPPELREEMAQLFAEAGRERVVEALAADAAALRGAPVLEALDHLLAGGRSGWRLGRWRLRVERSLSPYRRDPPFLHGLRYLAGLIRARAARGRGSPGKTLATGGVTVALVG